MSQKTILRCHCGKVECRATGRPFYTAVCYCDHCQEAARMIEESGDGPAVMDADGGTALCLIRDDRFQVTKGADLLTPHLRDPASATSRMVASCCHSAMFLRFSDGRFWKSAMVGRIIGERPQIEARLCTKFRDSALPWPDDAPRYSGFPVRALFMIARQWLSMRLGQKAV